MKKCATIIDFYNNTIEKYGENIAVIFENKKMTYAEVEVVANAIARKIMLAGGNTGGVVSVLVPRNEYTVICAIAAMKAGMAYLPIEDTLPEKRIKYMIEDSASSVVLTTEDFLPVVGNCAKCVVLPEDAREIMDWEKAEQHDFPSINRENLAIVLYTSGTTGNPKGAMIPHRAPVSLIRYVKEEYSITPDDVMGIYASYGFDAFPFCMLTALACGVACCIVPQRMKNDMKELYTYYYDNGVTLTLLPTAVGIPYMRNHDKGHLRVIFVGGEKMPAMNSKWEGCRVKNDYGPTETYVFCAEYEVQGNEQDVPIGKAVAENIIYILSEDGEIVKDGEKGEIVIAGPQVGKGYINQPTLTAKVFTPNPYADGDYSTLYHTGDIGYVREDGNIMIVGRKDKQIKIRGNRMEPSEVEKVISSFPGIEDVVVDAPVMPNGNKVLAAYVTSKVEIDEGQLIDFVAERCPHYMVPSAVMQLKELPINYNGKVDYGRLPMPELVRCNEYVAPRNEIEEMLCQAFSKVLGVESIGIDDNIIELGGDSLTVMRILEMCSLIPGLTAQILISEGTARKISQSLENMKRDTHDSGVIHSDYPLFGIQYVFYKILESYPSNMFLHVEKGIKMSKNIDTARLKSAIETAINCHPSLNSTFKRNADGEPRMYHHEGSTPFVKIIYSTEDEIETVKKEFPTPFDLATGPLYHIQIVETEMYKYLMIDIHHFVSDGASLEIFINDISDAYKGNHVEPEVWTVYDVAEYDNNLFDSPEYHECKKWYEKNILHLDCGNVVKGDLDKGDKPAKSCHISFPMGIKKVELEKACVRLDTTPAILTEAAYAKLISMYVGQEEVLFLGVSNGRDKPQKLRTMASLCKSHPVYCNTSMPIKVITAGMKKLRLNCIAHSAFPFTQTSLSPKLYAQQLFIFQAVGYGLVDFCGEPATSFTTYEDEVIVPLTCEVREDDLCEELYFYMSYDGNLYSEELMTRYKDDYIEILKSMIRP